MEGVPQLQAVQDFKNHCKRHLEGELFLHGPYHAGMPSGVQKVSTTHLLCSLGYCVLCVGGYNNGLTILSL